MLVGENEAVRLELDPGGLGATDAGDRVGAEQPDVFDELDPAYLLQAPEDLAGLNGAQYGTTINQGVVTASSTTVTAPNPSTNSTPPADTPGFTNVYAGEGVLDITPSSGAVPTSPNGTHVTAVASPTSLTISNAATASTTGQTTSDTNDQLSFGQDWAC